MNNVHLRQIVSMITDVPRFGLSAACLLPICGLLACTPENKARTTGDAQIQLLTAAALTLKQNMRNPESFVLESALLTDGRQSVCYTYRAQNGFGGMDRGYAVLAGANFDPTLDSRSALLKAQFKTSEESGFRQLWNKECANKAGQEKANLVKIGMGFAR
jgi:hypothetical protein